VTTIFFQMFFVGIDMTHSPATHARDDSKHDSHRNKDVNTL